jgi:molybdopterin/thiamine biosynthesis adenylyltransferase
MMKILSDREKERYRRQMMLNGFGVDQQLRLKNSTALVSGIGGLGGPAALYLAFAGIGKLVFVHDGKLTLSNMNRQVLMKHDGIGKTRVDQGKKTIQEINPDVEVETHDERATKSNVDRLLEGVDLVISARPNFEERRILNEACIKKGIPMVEAAMNGMEGYIFNIVPGKTPCLNCMYPENNPEWKELGFPVLGVVSAILGSLMALEGIKLLTGFGKPLLSQMLVYNTTDLNFKKFNIHKDKKCKVCCDVNHQ